VIEFKSLKNPGDIFRLRSPAGATAPAIAGLPASTPPNGAAGTLPAGKNDPIDRGSPNPATSNPPGNDEPTPGSPAGIPADGTPAPGNPPADTPAPGTPAAAGKL
jgi:hypothetical protein